MNEICLIVNADDFGMSRGITDAIIAAHRYGFLTSASLMANMPAAEYAVSRALAFPSLAVGAHLNICQGRPILPASEVQTLVATGGNFHPPREMARRLWMRRVAPFEIEREFRAQLRWIKQRGVVPSHADSHHHMHIYPAAAGAFVRALKAEGVACARACRCVEWPKRNAVGGPYGGGAFRRVFVQVYRSILERSVFRDTVSPDYRVVVLSSRAIGGALHKRWSAALQALPPGISEIACHPGLFEPGFSENDAIRVQREEELLCLTNRDLHDLIARRGIQLISYRDLQSMQRVNEKISEAAA
jgi:chitin disaccharide deacetylase